MENYGIGETRPDVGIYKGIPFEEYLKWDCFSHSMVRPISKSPAHLRSYLDRKTPETQSMKIGNAFECLLLEREAFKDRYDVIPNTYIDSKGIEKPWTRLSRTCKQYEIEAQEKGITLLTESELGQIELMVKSVKRHRAASELLRDSDSQVSVVWQDITTGIYCKGRFDVYKTNVIVDLKSTQDASVEAFSRSMLTWNYHVQAAMYIDAFCCGYWGSARIAGSADQPEYYLIAVESVPPYACAVYRVGIESICAGQSAYIRALRIFADVKETGNWHGYSEFVQDINIPRYAIAKENDENEF